MEIRKYIHSDEQALFELMREEEAWSCYDYEQKPKYINALNTSVTYVIIEDNLLCGFIRCRDDSGFGIYILDLLVQKKYRGRQFGRHLIEKIVKTYPNDIVYVTSGVDEYYEKLGCKREGTVFEVHLRLQ